MDDKIELLLLSYTIDQICYDQEVSREVILRYMIEEDMFDLKEYFKEEYEEDD